jgi:sulfur carrier protein ThiS
MKIKLKIFGYLIYQSGFREKEVTILHSITVAELLPLINLKKQSLMIITRNGKKINPDDKIEDGDRIVIAPFFSGG